MLEVKIFIDDGDIYKGEQMAEAIMKFLIQHHIIGATVLDSRMGYGKHRHLHKPKVIGSSDDQPLIIIIIDEEEPIKKILPDLRVIAGDSLITLVQTDSY